MKTIVLLCFLLMSNLTGIGQGLTLPYYSGFDSGSETAGWQQFRMGNDPAAFQWNVGGGGFSATSCLSHDYNVGANTTDTVIDWYVSPPMNFTTNAVISLKVKTSGFSTPTPDNCEVYFGTDDPDPATGNFTLIGTLSYMQPQFTWIDTSLSIPFTSDSGYVAFKYKTIGAAWMTYAIDNITVDADTAASLVEAEIVSGSLEIYPNPFSTLTTINLHSLSYHGSHDIRIYDVSGKEVKSYLNVQHPILLQKESLSPGIYLVELKNKEKMLDTKKLIVE